MTPDDSSCCPHLEPRWGAEVAHAVLDLGVIGALRRPALGR
jgi:hypothetical protein